jgi:hypothetical protein
MWTVLLRAVACAGYQETNAFFWGSAAAIAMGPDVAWRALDNRRQMLFFGAALASKRA